MNKILLSLLIAAAPLGARAHWTDAPAAKAADQLAYQVSQIPAPGMFPRALFTDYSIPQVEMHMGIPVAEFKPEVGLRNHPDKDSYLTVQYCDYHDWTSGFVPGSLWLAYELTGREDLRDSAAALTNRLLPVSHKTDTHDLGFMVNCSYGNAMRLAPADSIKDVIVRTADNLIARFDPKVGLIRSWDFGPWNYPVIIDNMMNLQLLFNASRLTGDSKYRDIAVRHADKTILNHFRPDYSCYHVVSYDAQGRPERKQTFQGKADESAWARGQAWALYGYTECFRETGEQRYLDQARNIAAMIMDRNNTEDLIPYWDFDAIPGDVSPRDASAAAVIASALIELESVAPDADGKYRDYAERILHSLATDKYTAAQGTNGGFVLMHSTGSLPHGSEIDTPLNYADYYYLEALNRLRRLDAHREVADWARIAR